MANKQDIITAIKNLDIFLKVPELKGAKVRLNKNGNPFAYVGGFNMVFQLEKDNKKWAFRVWHTAMGDTKKRYQSISKYLEEKKLPYFAEFIFDEKGILVNGELLDTIRMKWLDDMLFKKYIEKHINNPIILEKLADDFAIMCKDLRDNEISHGDLQEGNILVTENGEIKLIDYDSICIPSIDGQKELVIGLKGYQHPSRFSASKASIKADYFSELIIYLSVKCFALNPKLWDKYLVKDTQYLLFTENDFTNFTNSNIYNDINGLSKKTDELLAILTKFININSYLDIKPFSSSLLPPLIKYFKADKEVLIQGCEITIEWEVENTLDVEINNNIGKVLSKDKLTIKPKDNFEYIIKAIGFNQTIEKKINLSIFPTPIIKSLSIPTPNFKQKVILKIETPKFNYTNSVNINNAINISSHKIEKIPYSQNIIFPMKEIQKIKKELNQQNVKYKLVSIYEKIRKRLAEFNR
ncbi:hypothetical protein [Tenacibaculum finnmarkense]|uniref:hypothetical protein n=1 Tax=Tenacibaculum TaxID=104267 RepID=UPI001E2E751D|nr:hypothetical protein [Tenacibaculum finnmarkense]MCD8408803.1 hypothetical protein [Tenacibaculum finnmarkense genomovar ulcerans]MCD8421426.1 hypothetical protein [Tenacibaculum finnmarkense genomovar ulcerans]MCG8237558.1 hypothetical protein [Tenacibaculum finnmarkense genomovar ulcerans]